MLRDIFPSYRELPLSADDVELQQWLNVAGEVPGTWWDIMPIKSTWDNIAEMNVQVNKAITYQLDPTHTWHNANQILRTGVGDCKDYSVVKYALLREAGVEAGVLLCEIARMPVNPHHAFVIAELDGERRVLDNLFPQLIDPLDYINLVPRKLFLSGCGILFAKTIVLNDYNMPEDA